MNDEQITDDMYPHNGSTFYQPTEPQEQVAERAKEKATALEALPFFEDILTRLNKDIQDCSDIQTAIYEAKTRGMSIEPAVHGLDVARARLTAMKEYIEGLSAKASKPKS